MSSMVRENKPEGAALYAGSEEGKEKMPETERRETRDKKGAGPRAENPADPRNDLGGGDRDAAKLHGGSRTI